MDDDWRYPHFRKPAYIYTCNWNCTPKPKQESAGNSEIPNKPAVLCHPLLPPLPLILGSASHCISYIVSGWEFIYSPTSVSTSVTPVLDGQLRVSVQRHYLHLSLDQSEPSPMTYHFYGWDFTHQSLYWLAKMTLRKTNRFIEVDSYCHIHNVWNNQ